MNKTIAPQVYYKIIELKPDVNMKHKTPFDKVEYNKECFNDIADLLDIRYGLKVRIKEIYANKDKGIIEITTIHNDKVKLVKSAKEQ